MKALATFVRTHGEEPSTQVGMFSPGASVHQYASVCISASARPKTRCVCILHVQVVVPRLLLPTPQSKNLHRMVGSSLWWSCPRCFDLPLSLRFVQDSWQSQPKASGVVVVAFASLMAIRSRPAFVHITSRFL